MGPPHPTGSRHLVGGWGRAARRTDASPPASLRLLKDTVPSRLLSYGKDTAACAVCDVVCCVLGGITAGGARAHAELRCCLAQGDPATVTSGCF